MIKLRLNILCIIILAFNAKLHAVDNVNQSFTLADLKRIAVEANVVLPAHISGLSPEQQIALIIKTMSEHSGNINAQDFVKPLLGGEQALLMAIKIENVCSQRGGIVWWRFSDDVNEDIKTGKAKSFAKSFMGGYLNDGGKFFATPGGGFSTACTFIYLRNCQYFTQEFLKDQNEFLNDFKMYLEKFPSIDLSKWNQMVNYREEQGLSLGLKSHEPELLVTLDKFIHANRDVIEEYISAVQEIPGYDVNIHKEELERLYARFQPLFLFRLYQKVLPALLGTLYALPLSHEEEARLLKNEENRRVASSEYQVFDRGEEFHPRLTHQQLVDYQSKLIPIFHKGEFLPFDVIVKKLQEKFQ